MLCSRFNWYSVRVNGETERQDDRIVVYYLLLQAGQTAGVDDVLSPMFAMWLPNIVVGVCGGTLSLWVMGEGKLRAWRERDRKVPLVVNSKAES